MARGKIDPVKLKRYIREGKRQRQIAQIFGVSDSAISQRLKCLNLSVAKATQIEHGHAIVMDSLDCVHQLQKINEEANFLLNLLMSSIRGEKWAELLLRKHQKLSKKKKYEDERSLALKTMKEIRGQLKLQVHILKSVADFRAVADFQKEVIEIICQMDLEMRKKFINKLKEKKSLRSAVRL